MNVKRWWCLLVIISFSMPVFAATPYQIDSLDDINDTNWVETTGAGYGSYMEQELVGGANEVNEGTGSMKFDFTTYVAGDRDDEVIRTFSPALDFNNYEDLAITLWVWTNDPNYTVSYLASKRGTRLQKIILNDGSARVGVFTLPHLKDIGWNKVIAPLRNFIWDDEATDPCDVDWDDITKIKLWARTEHATDHNDALYLDDLQLEEAPDPCSKPYQLASFDSIWDELWYEDHGNSLMLQIPGGDANYIEPNGFINFYDFALYAGNYTGDMNDFAGFADIWLEEIEPDNEYNLYTADDLEPNGVINFFDFAAFAEDWRRSSYD